MAKQRMKTESELTDSRSAAANSTLEARNQASSADIAAMAYQLWIARGCPEGSPEVDWFQAEENLRRELGRTSRSSVNEPLLMRGTGA